MWLVSGHWDHGREAVAQEQEGARLVDVNVVCCAACANLGGNRCNREKTDSISKEGLMQIFFIILNTKVIFYYFITNLQCTKRKKYDLKMLKK